MDSELYNPIVIGTEEQHRLLASHGKRPQVAAFISALFDTPPFDEPLTGSEFVAYSVVYVDLVETTAIGLDALIENEGTQADFLRFVARLLSAFEALGRATRLGNGQRSWRFPAKLAAVLSEIGKTLQPA